MGQALRKNQEPAQLCASVSAHKWYTGPICENPQFLGLGLGLS